MEPSPVLVRTLEVEVGGPGKVRALFEDGFMADSRIEPDIENILFEREILALAGGTREVLQEPLLDLRVEPEIHTLPFGPVCDRVDEIAVECALPALVAGIGRDGDAPGTLAGEAPVRTRFDHAPNPVFSLFRNPLDLSDGREGPFPELFRLQREKPLGGGPVIDRVFAPPAMGIGMFQDLLVEKGSRPFQEDDHLGAGFQDPEPCP